MADIIMTGPVHHLALTVTDVERSVAFYTTVLNFQVLASIGPRMLLQKGALVLTLGHAPDHPRQDDRFDENRVGLDHLSFAAGQRADLERAVLLLEERGAAHGEIKDLSPAGLPIYVLAFRDPDNIQLELTAPH
jgi:catechol 2,3-dioxygenase-like lactoylglutathione lyase family enzyme